HLHGHRAALRSACPRHPQRRRVQHQEGGTAEPDLSASAGRQAILVSSVMTGLVPVIHDFLAFGTAKSWMAGPSPAMTIVKRLRDSNQAFGVRSTRRALSARLTPA